MQDFRSVGAWSKAHGMVLRIYRETAGLPQEEVFGIKLQLRRSAVAVASRIAEGCGRPSDAEFAGDLRKVVSGCNELEYLILLTTDLQLWSRELGEEIATEVIEVRKMTLGLLKKL